MFVYIRRDEDTLCGIAIFSIEKGSESLPEASIKDCNIPFRDARHLHCNGTFPLTCRLVAPLTESDMVRYVRRVVGATSVRSYARSFNVTAFKIYPPDWRRAATLAQHIAGIGDLCEAMMAQWGTTLNMTIQC